MAGPVSGGCERVALWTPIALTMARATIAGLALMPGSTSFAADTSQRAPFPTFERHVIDAQFPGAYSCAVADVDGDGRLDVIAQGRQVAWFRNPHWERYPISTSVTRANIYIAPHDITGDGLPELVLAHDFNLGDSTVGGTISWLERSGDMSAEWILHRIDAEPTAHRVFWADFDGLGRKELLVIPILGPGAKAPDYDQASVRLLAYFPPDQPRKDRWPKQLIDNSLHLSHAVRVVDFDGDGRDEFLMVSFEGVFLFDSTGVVPDMKWTKRKLGQGYQSEPAPRRGASEVALGRLAGGGRFLATIEPWHGCQVVVYTPPPVAADSDALWTRHVIDGTLDSGHALTVADVDGDGSDEIFAGFRGQGTSLHGYDPRAGGQEWQRFVLDRGGIAGQGCAAADLDGDGDQDLVAVGGATHNINWYENRRGTTP